MTWTDRDDYDQSRADHAALLDQPAQVVTCQHCARRIEWHHIDGWIDPEATGDDRVWRTTCDQHATFIADHEPHDGECDACNDRPGDVTCPEHEAEAEQDDYNKAVQYHPPMPGPWEWTP